MHGRADKIVDILSVVLISVAAVLTALCGYQSGLWEGEQTRMYSSADANRQLAAQDADRANALTNIDIAIFTHWVQAADSGNTRFATFLYRRFRPEFVPALRAWVKTKPFDNAKAPSSPFVMPEYRLESRAEAETHQKLATAASAAATLANHHSDEFLLLTVIFAGVSFLAGISTKMVYPNHAIVVALSIIGAIYGTVRLFELPFIRMN